MNDLSVAAVILILVIYAVVAWAAPRRIEEKWPTILLVSSPFGILAGFIFVSEVLLEYVLLPANNAQMGVVEFGLVMFVYALVRAIAASRYGNVGAGTIALPQRRSSVRLFGSLRCWPYSIGFAARHDPVPS